MIEIKNVTQIGTPREEDKIYVENYAYTRMREESYQDKRVFVLMGHTERMEGKYATFIEAVIPVREMEFTGIVPQWNNGLWSQVFKEVKRLYEDMIIVGWAMDARGMSPKITPELERIHRESFGGVHQLLLLMDSMEQDETFYIYKENKIVPKDGFFIYYRARKNKKMEEHMEVIDFNKETQEAPKEKEAEVELTTEIEYVPGRGRYRQMLAQEKKLTEGGNAGLAIAVAMLVFVIAVGAYENRDSRMGGKEPVHTEAGASASESEETSSSEDSEAVDATPTIPVEVVPGN